MLHGGTQAWCSVIVAPEPHSSALRICDRGQATELMVRLANLEALHHGALSGEGGTMLYLQGTVVGSAAIRFRRQYGGDAFSLVMTESMALWLQAFSTFRWKVAGDRETFADAWRRLVVGHFQAVGNAAPATATECVAGPASRPCGRGREVGPEGSAEAPPQKGPPSAVWQLH